MHKLCDWRLSHASASKHVACAALSGRRSMRRPWRLQRGGRCSMAGAAPHAADTSGQAGPMNDCSSYPLLEERGITFTPGVLGADC